MGSQRAKNAIRPNPRLNFTSDEGEIVTLPPLIPQARDPTDPMTSHNRSTCEYSTSTKNYAAKKQDANNGRAASTDGCLHCHNITSTDIQVRCYECSRYVCGQCHWCHEFQANHEIRVCDRCDAFYCRGCDEMDQCDDCAEVVCMSCSTLLSCKFCGCGLCEECAIACGR